MWIKNLERRDKQNLGLFLAAIPALVLFYLRQNTKIPGKWPVSGWNSCCLQNDNHILL
jgi:hypothetical protein